MNKIHDDIHGNTAAELLEMQAIHKVPMTMENWEKRLNGFLTLWNRDVLQDNGKITAELAKNHAATDGENVFQMALQCIATALAQ